tara:strand:+ start:114 stop:392 length:279 start_codon:yes stop_codon:yes gene_type:complete
VDALLGIILPEYDRLIIKYEIINNDVTKKKIIEYLILCLFLISKKNRYSKNANIIKISSNRDKTTNTVKIENNKIFLILFSLKLKKFFFDIK